MSEEEYQPIELSFYITVIVVWCLFVFLVAYAFTTWNLVN